MKSDDVEKTFWDRIVTPFVGVWIEMRKSDYTPQHRCVTPFVGVWIEIQKIGVIDGQIIVTPFVGVWIEIHFNSLH